MKKVFTIIILMLAFVVEAQSQTSLQIAELFNGSYKRKDNAIEVVVKGNQLERYKLEVFRSLTIKNDPKDFERIEKLVEQDEKHAISKETHWRTLVLCFLLLLSPKRPFPIHLLSEQFVTKDGIERIDLNLYGRQCNNG